MVIWANFLGGVPGQSCRREASTWTFLEWLDIFSDATNTKIILTVTSCRSGALRILVRRIAVFIFAVPAPQAAHKPMRARVP